MYSYSLTFSRKQCAMLLCSFVSRFIIVIASQKLPLSSHQLPLEINHYRRFPLTIKCRNSKVMVRLIYRGLLQSIHGNINGSFTFHVHGPSHIRKRLIFQINHEFHQNSITIYLCFLLHYARCTCTIAFVYVDGLKGRPTAKIS